MPLSDSQIAATIKSTLGHIGKGGGTINAVKVRDAIAKRLGVTDPAELTSMLAHVTQTKRLAEAGDRIDADLSSLDPVKSLPLDRSLEAVKGKYGYRVLITVTDPDTLSAASSMELVYSNTPLSPAEVEQAAYQQWERTRYDIVTDPKINQMSASANISARVITAGRAP